MNANQLRDIMISNIQTSIKFIRPLLGLTVQEMAELMGVTRQTINDLESNKRLMSITEYIVICAIIDNKCKENYEVLRAINAIIRANSITNIDIDFNELYNGLFLEKWFSTFSNYELVKDDEIYGWDMLDQDLLEKLAANYKIFIDYDSLMIPESEIFFKRFTKILRKNKNKIIIPLRIIEKLENLAKEDDDKLSIQAKHAIKCIVQMQSEEVIQIRGEENDLENSNDLFLDLFGKYNGEYNLALITQNKYLAHMVMNIESYDSLNMLCKINSINELSQWYKEKLDNDIKESEEIYSDMPETILNGGWEIL